MTPDLRALRALMEAATPAPWRSCTWDPMEIPHVHKDEPDTNYCDPKRDIPGSKEDCDLIVALRNNAEALLAAAEDAERYREALANLSRVLEQRIDSDANDRVRWMPDHACAKCVPGGEIVIPDFLCARHRAAALTPNPEPRDE